MSVVDQDFSTLLEEARSGSGNAAAMILERYGHHVLRVIRRRLARQMRSKFDSQDFMQAVWASFFTGGAIPQFTSPEELVAFLGRMAGNKVTDEVRRRLILKKANVNREVSLASLEESQLPVRRRDGTASQFAMAKEQLDALLAGQPPHYRRIVELRAAGATYGEIASHVNLHEGTVRRVLSKLEERRFAE